MKKTPEKMNDLSSGQEKEKITEKTENKKRKKTVWYDSFLEESNV